MLLTKGPVATQRRGRNGSGARKKQRQLEPPRQQSQSTSEEESTDGGSVTRCVCGETHNMGLMVQCDQCEVWQHCDCVGLEEKDIPEQYYCEECRPENHSLVKANHGSRMRRSYSAVGRSTATSPGEKKAPKKRMTFNSREASMSLEDVLAARNALEITRSFLDPVPGSPPHSHPPLTSSPGEITESNPHSDNHKPNERMRDDTEPEMEEDDKPSTPMVMNSQGDLVDSLMKDAVTTVEDDVHSDSVKSVKPKRCNSGRSTKLDENVEGGEQTVLNGRVTKTTEKRGRGATNGRRGNGTARRCQSSRPRSRTSTPQPSEHGCTSTPDPQLSIFEKLSPAARESSPPAKIRYPSSRMTISEMNRRTRQILEYISSIQVEMANKDTIGLPRTVFDTASIGTRNVVQAPSELRMVSNDHIHPLGAGTGRSNGKPAAIIIPTKKDDDSPSSSMSSASTIPLDEPIDERLHQEKSVAEEALERMNTEKLTDEEKGAQSSLEIMDMLTRELIKFQRRFGSASASNFGRMRSRDSRMDEVEGEGRTTRSREASTNSTTFVSEKRMAQA